jgi:hypothetical protein
MRFWFANCLGIYLQSKWEDHTRCLGWSSEVIWHWWGYSLGKYLTWLDPPIMLACHRCAVDILLIMIARQGLWLHQVPCEPWKNEWQIMKPGAATLYRPSLREAVSTIYRVGGEEALNHVAQAIASKFHKWRSKENNGEAGNMLLEGEQLTCFLYLDWWRENASLVMFLILLACVAGSTQQVWTGHIFCRNIVITLF